MNLFNQILRQNQVDLMECQWCEESWKSWRHSDTTGLSLLPLLKDTYLKSLISTITEKKEGRREEREKEGKERSSKQINLRVKKIFKVSLTPRDIKVFMCVHVHVWCTYVHTCIYESNVKQLTFSYILIQACLEHCSSCPQGGWMKIFRELQVL